MSGTSSEANPASGFVTVIHAPQPEQATKAVIWHPALQEWGFTGPGKVTLWSEGFECPVGGIDDLAEVVELARSEPRAVLLGGRLTAELRARLAVDRSTQFRRIGVKLHGATGNIEDVPRRWVVIDFDNWRMPDPDMLATDPEYVIDAAIHDQLPECFHDVRAYWQLSASAGFGHDILKAHVFFWLASDISNDDLKNVLRDHATALRDYSTYNAHQEILVQNPIVLNRRDPLPRRTGWRAGTETAVVLPPVREIGATERNRRKREGNVSPRNIGLPGDPLARLGDFEGGNGFHEPLRTATLRYAGACVWGRRTRDDDAFLAALYDAVEAAPRLPGGKRDAEVRAHLAGLPRLLSGAFELARRSATPTRPVATLPAHAVPAGLSVEAARDEVAGAVERFLAEARAYAWRRASGEAGYWDAGREEWVPEEPLRLALATTTGVGKSAITRRALPDFIAALKGRTAAGRDGSTALAWRVLVTVPEHVLGAAAAAGVTALGLAAAVWRGREAADPEASGETMCRNLAAVAAARRIGADIETAVCGQPGGACCPFRSACGYQRQIAAAAASDVVVAAHNLLYGGLPQSISRGLALIVIDEAFWAAGLHEPAVIDVAGLADISPVLRREDGRQVEDAGGTQALRTVCRRLGRVLAELRPGEFVSRSVCWGAGLTREACAEAAKAEWRRKREDLLAPDMSETEREAALKVGASNAGIGQRARLWHALAGLLAAGAEGEPEERRVAALQVRDEANDGAAEPCRVVVVRGRREFGRTANRAPMLHLDATASPDIVARWGFDVVRRIDAVAEHARFTQITGHWGKGALGARGTGRPRIIDDLRAFVALHSGGNALVVTYKSIEGWFSDLPDVRAAHFGSISGLDRYGDVRALFVLGRPLPQAAAVRELALALGADEPPPPVEDGADFDIAVPVRDGSRAPLRVRRFVDLHLDAVREAVADAAVVQAVGRGRAVNRTSVTPLDVFVFADVALPHALDEVRAWAPPNALERQMGMRGWATASATDAPRLFPDLFSGHEAARLALKPMPPGWRAPPGFVVVRYQPAGRQPWRTGYARAELIERMRLELEDKLGRLAGWRVEPGPEAPADSTAADAPPEVTGELARPVLVPLAGGPAGESFFRAPAHRDGAASGAGCPPA